jgi:hypothetical protein
MEKASSYGIGKVVHKAFLMALEQITKSPAHHSMKPCTVNQHVYLLLFRPLVEFQNKHFCKEKDEYVLFDSFTCMSVNPNLT